MINILFYKLYKWFQNVKIYCIHSFLRDTVKTFNIITSIYYSNKNFEVKHAEI